MELVTLCSRHAARTTALGLNLRPHTFQDQAARHEKNAAKDRKSKRTKSHEEATSYCGQAHTSADHESCMSNLGY